MRDYRAGQRKLTSKTTAKPFYIYLLLGPVKGKSRNGGAHGVRKFWRGLPGVYCPIQSVVVVVDQSIMLAEPKAMQVILALETRRPFGSACIGIP